MKSFTLERAAKLINELLDIIDWEIYTGTTAKNNPVFLVVLTSTQMWLSALLPYFGKREKC